MSNLALTLDPHRVAPMSATRPEVVRTHSLAKTYQMGANGVQALRGVDLTIERGEFVSIMGPSGCGKSTLLHLLGGLLQPTSGRLFIDEQEMTDMSDAERTELRRTTIGFIFQRFNLFTTLTVDGNLGIAEKIRYGSWCARPARRQELMDLLGIADKAAHKPMELSGGEQQRVAIARALIHQPKLLLADEPTGNLDSENAETVLNVLKDLNERLGQTIVMITHNPEAAEYGSRVVHMKDGRIHD